MRKCSNCINGYYSYMNGIEELLCGIDTYYEKKVDPSYHCEYHNFAVGCKNECNELLFDDSCGITGFVIVHKLDGNVDRVLRLYRLVEDDNVYYQFDMDNYRHTNTNSFTFRCLDDDENGLFSVFVDFYKKVVNMEPQAFFDIAFNRLVVRIDFPTKLIVKKEENNELYNVVEELYDDLELLYPPRLMKDNDNILTLS